MKVAGRNRDARWPLLFSTLLVGVALVLYRSVLRPRQLRWGATEEEVAADMPGDELISAPTLVSTRAVTVSAATADVWPWLAQLGQGRGGFYSHDWIENLIGLRIHSSDRVLTEHQDVEVGDRIALAPDGSGLDVERVEPGRLLILREPSGGWTWTFLLTPLGRHTRLIVRNRWTTAGGSPWFRAYMALIDPAAFIMERKMLLGIRERAERTDGSP